MQNFAVDDAYGSVHTTDSERKENMKKLLLMALLKVSSRHREHDEMADDEETHANHTGWG
jgi:hypothetical protein